MSDWTKDTLQTLTLIWVAAAAVANLDTSKSLGVVHSTAVWIYVIPLSLVTYVIPTMLPSLILPNSVLATYNYRLADLVGVEMTCGLSVDNLVEWWPEQNRRGEHLPAHFRGLYWMDGNGGCKGSGASDIASLGGGSWNTETRVLSLPLYDPWTFTHHPANAGDVVRAFGIGWTYVFHFDHTLQWADITLQIFGVDLPTGSLGSFEIKASGPKSDPGKTWDRPTWAGSHEAGAPADHFYILRRLVNEKGQVDQQTVDMFRRAYNPKLNGNVTLQGYGASGERGICTDANQLIRTN